MSIVRVPDAQVESHRVTSFYERVRTNLFRVLASFDRYKPGEDFTGFSTRELLDDLSQIRSELRLIQTSLHSSDIEDDWVGWAEKRVTSLLSSCTPSKKESNDLLRQIFRVGSLYEIIPTLDLMVMSHLEQLQK